MQAVVQQPIVKSASARFAAKRPQAQSAPKTAAGPKAGTRFLGYLMAALGAPAV